ncbi:MAG: hypothetical protein D8M59_08840 [Planctomycetes bacterium]|nr:hypothetical protein [Planctomycetota bacterium]NOG53895.1 hypothetical protein [Planctomycetota bacterium]
MADDNATASRQQHRTPAVRFTPSAQVIEQLIRRAEKHPLGMEYLVNGSLDSVSATFGVHAFVVDAAREKLGNNGAVVVPPSGQLGAMTNKQV